MKWPETIPEEEMELLRREWTVTGGEVHTDIRAGHLVFGRHPNGDYGAIYGPHTAKGWVLVMAAPWWERDKNEVP